MSSVSPSDNSGLPNYYHQTLRDMQDQIAAEGKRNRDLQEQQTEALEKNYQAAIARKDKETDEVVQNVRDSSREAIAQEKDKFDAALYDKDRKLRSQSQANDPGQGGLANYYHKTIEDLQDQSKAELDRTHEHFEKRAEELAGAHRQELLKREKDHEDTISNIKESANDTISRDRQQNQSEYEKLKNQTYNSRGQIPGSVSPEVYKRDLQSVYDSAQIQHDNDQSAMKQIEREHHDQFEGLNYQNSNRIKDLTSSQAKEIDNYEEQLKSLSDFNRQQGKKQAQATQEVALQSQRENQDDRKTLNDSLTAITDRQKREINDKDAFFARKNAEAIKEKEDYFTSQYANQNRENYRATKNLQDQFSSQVGQFEKEKMHDRDAADGRLSALLTRSYQDRQDALENQAKGYAETLDASRKGDQDTISVLEKSLQKQKTSLDTSEVSPAVEAQVRKNLIKDYEKQISTEVERNKISTDHMQKKYVDQYQKALEETADKTALLYQQNANERTTTEGRYLSSMQETEYRADAKARDQQASHDRENENMYRQFSNLMDRQRRDYEHILDTAQSDSENRFSSFRQESENNSKMAQRAFNTKQNELIHEYDKKLADQKSEYDFKLEDLKAQAQLDARNAERLSKKEIEEQAKGYEQRIAQLEAQSQERERYMAQNYQDELDRTKRSYELISKKKS